MSSSSGDVSSGLVALVAWATLAAPSAALVPASATPAGPVISGSGGAGVKAHLRADLGAYLQERGTAEHLTAVGLSMSLPDRWSTIDVSAGTTTFGGPVPVRSDSVWQIGSNTKALTSVLLLQLEASHRLSIGDPLGRWLPQYLRWRNVPIRRLLNLTAAGRSARPAGGDSRLCARN